MNIRFGSKKRASSVATEVKEIDEVTGVLSKTEFLYQMKHNLLEYQETDFYLIVTNIVSFRVINELFGHHTGDKVLKNVATAMKNYCGDGAVVGRLESDHMAMLIPKDLFSEESFINEVLESPIITKNISYQIQIKAGILHVDDRRVEAKKMCDHALTACRASGDSIKKLIYFEEGMFQDLRKQQEILLELQIAVKEKQFVPFLQPQFDADKKVTGAEVLARWEHPEWGLIPPKDFMDISEKSGMIVDIDYQIWEKTCQLLKKWNDDGEKIIPLSINISPIDLGAMDVVEKITRLTKKYGVSSQWLRLEITETAWMLDEDDKFNLIEKFRDRGFKVEMDDFGKGYSSFGLLSKMDIDVLKLDMELVSEIDKRPKGKAILELIYNLSKKLLISTIVEGVEKEEQFEMLKEMGYQVFQGYLFSKPIPVKEFENKYLGE